MAEVQQTAECRSASARQEDWYDRELHDHDSGVEVGRLIDADHQDGRNRQHRRHGNQVEHAGGMPAFGTHRDDDLDSWKRVAFTRHLPTLSENEELEMEKMNPKSPQEMEEEQEEENFLNGSPTHSQPQPTH